MKTTLVVTSILALTAVAGATRPAPPPPPAMPAPAPEIAEAAKALVGSWKCTGTGMTMNGEAKMTASEVTKLDLDKYFLVTTTTVKIEKTTIKMVAYTTWENGHWRRIQAMNDGTTLTGIAQPAKDGKLEFLLDANGPTMSGQFKDAMDMTNPKAIVVSGQMTMDKKTWMPVYTMTCKK